jgi:hypothetical protein
VVAPALGAVVERPTPRWQAMAARGELLAVAAAVRVQQLTRKLRALAVLVLVAKFG